MITLTIIILNVIPDVSFFHVLIVGMVIDLFMFLYFYFTFEKQKKKLNEKYTKIINKYKAEQVKYEELIEQYASAQSEEDDKKGILSYNLKEQQELRNKLENSIGRQKEQEKELDTYKTKLQEYMGKIKKQEKTIETYKATLKKHVTSEKTNNRKELKEKPEESMMKGLKPIPSDVNI